MSAPMLSLSRRLRKSPFEGRSHRGVRAASVYNHVVLPTAYASLEEDYGTSGSTFRSGMSRARCRQIRGPDALRLVEYLTPRDLSKIVPGQCLRSVDRRHSWHHQ